MKISIFGLGYVGCVSMGCLAELGHEVIGVEVSQSKIDLINSGKPTIVEKDIDTLIEKHHRNGRICATTDTKNAVLNSDVSIICVGTPSTADGSLNLNYIYDCAAQIGASLKNKETYHVVVIRSTVMPGTNNKVANIVAQSSGKTINDEYSVVSNPEFLREGSAVKDYFHPPVTVIGSDSSKGLSVMREVYKDIDAAIAEVEVGVAEIIKYVNNSYHALKVTFANEVGNVCKQMGIDSHKVMEVFCMDRQLNISDYYFKPGFAYGGSCLPKDLGAMVALSHSKSLEANVLGAVHRSNEFQKDIAYRLIQGQGKTKIGLLGISFKAGTDDLRYSPMVDLMQLLLKDGNVVMVYDENVRVSLGMGANRDYIDTNLPDLDNMLVADLNTLVAGCELIVISQKTISISEIIDANPDKVFIDLVRVDRRVSGGNYLGICW